MNNLAHELTADEMLAEDMARFYYDPLGFVMYAYPWGHGELAGFDGPFDWQREFLEDWGEQLRDNKFDGVHAVDAVRKGVGSGHGIGKSALTAWITDFIMSTRPYCVGTITAGTNKQLETKTWAQIGKWTRLCITAHWFKITSGRGSMTMRRHGHRESWFVSAQTCKEENSEAFAGQHAVTSTSFYIFDEGSAVPDSIYEVAEGGLTDGEPMIFVFGNKTRNEGMFKKIFTKFRRLWTLQNVDSREVPITNKRQIEQWRETWGEDSDFFRVRVLGKFPRASDMQLIPEDLVDVAESREYHPSVWSNAVKVLGVDVARFGSDQSVLIIRQGLQAYDLVKKHGLDTMTLASFIADVIDSEEDPFDGVLLDVIGIGAGVYDRLVQLGYRQVIPVNCALPATESNRFLNLRMEMYWKLKEWLVEGAIPKDSELHDDLIAPQYGYKNKRGLMQLESKEDMRARGLPSPDCGDALALTLAVPVKKREVPPPRNVRASQKIVKKKGGRRLWRHTKR